MISKEKNKFYINPKRLIYLLELYDLNIEKLLPFINEKRKRDTYSVEQIKSIMLKEEKVDESFLKRVDKVFNAGLTWIISQRPLPDKKRMSIFFRKDTFNSELNLESRKKITQFEDLKTEISIMSKQIGFDQQRKLETYTTRDNPKIIASIIRLEFERITKTLLKENEIKKHNDEKSFLKNIISVCEYLNIFVFEFIDHSRKFEKTIRFNGFFTSPNLIAIKRNQKYMKREIFTLAHELAHFLINSEEIDNIEETYENGRIERWCNDFAFYFLLGKYVNSFTSLEFSNEENNYNRSAIKTLSEKTYLSEYAFFTRLKIEGRISDTDYNYIKGQIEASFRASEEARRAQIESENQLAELKGEKLFRRGAVAIKSKLFEEIVKLNFYQGKIDENQTRKLLKINPKKTLDEVIY